ncbi:MAG: PQQ-binding-like beta-propeller repeat protein [Gemmataceae bacterium]
MTPPTIRSSPVTISSSPPPNTTGSRRLDVKTGQELWTFFADGPIRFAPVAWENDLYVAGDDGTSTALNADDGGLLWKASWRTERPEDPRQRARLHLARPGPVIEGGTIYYSASIWPLHGHFHPCSRRQDRQGDLEQ